MLMGETLQRCPGTSHRGQEPPDRYRLHRSFLKLSKEVDVAGGSETTESTRVGVQGLLVFSLELLGRSD